MQNSAFTKLRLSDKLYQIILVILLITSSGFPLFVNNKSVDVITFIYVIIGCLYYRPKMIWIYILTLCFSMIMFAETIYFGEFYIKTAIYQIILFFSAGSSVLLLGINLIYIIEKVMLVIATISLLLFIPITINYNFFNLLISISPIVIKNVSEAYGYEFVSYNIILMNFPPDFFDGLVRNSGPFWEPGAFGGFLVLSFVLNTLITNTIYRKENIIYIIAIITTFSTTTYLAFFFFFTAFSFVNTKSQIIKWGSLIIFLSFIILSFQELDFLGKKIQKEFEETKYQAFTKGGDTRMASAYMDLKEICEDSFFVVFGRGSHPDTRIQGLDKKVLRTNGITDLLSRFGMLYFIFAIIALHKSFQKIALVPSKKMQMASVALATLLILAFSEVYFIYIYFKVLMLFYNIQSINYFDSIRYRCITAKATY